MTLKTYTKHKILLLSCVHRFHNVLDQYIVFRPSVLSKLQNIHKFLTRIRIKADMVKHLCTTVKITSIIVKRMSSVPKGTQRRGRALALLLLQHCFIRIFPWSKIPEIHTSQNFKFCIGRSRAHRRYFKISRRIILIHLSQIRTCIL